MPLGGAGVVAMVAIAPRASTTHPREVRLWVPLSACRQTVHPARSTGSVRRSVGSLYRATGLPMTISISLVPMAWTTGLAFIRANPTPVIENASPATIRSCALTRGGIAHARTVANRRGKNESQAMSPILPVHHEGQCHRSEWSFRRSSNTAPIASGCVRHRNERSNARLSVFTDCFLAQ